VNDLKKILLAVTGFCCVSLSAPIYAAVSVDRKIDRRFLILRSLKPKKKLLKNPTAVWAPNRRKIVKLHARLAKEQNPSEIIVIKNKLVLSWRALKKQTRVRKKNFEKLKGEIEGLLRYKYKAGSNPFPSPSVEIEDVREFMYRTVSPSFFRASDWKSKFKVWRGNHKRWQVARGKEKVSEKDKIFWLIGQSKNLVSGAGKGRHKRNFTIMSDYIKRLYNDATRQSR